MARAGVWTAGAFRGSWREFFREVANAADIRWDWPEVDAQLKNLPQWEQFEALLLEALDVQTRPAPAPQQLPAAETAGPQQAAAEKPQETPTAPSEEPQVSTDHHAATGTDPRKAAAQSPDAALEATDSQAGPGAPLKKETRDILREYDALDPKTPREKACGILAEKVYPEEWKNAINYADRKKLKNRVRRRLEDHGKRPSKL